MYDFARSEGGHALRKMTFQERGLMIKAYEKRNLKRTNNTDENMLDSNISSYKIIIIVVILILILCIIGYFVSFSYRESKALYELGVSKNYMFIDSKINTVWEDLELSDLRSKLSLELKKKR